MANRWGIPKEVEDFVKHRDSQCVYCGVSFSPVPEVRKHKPSWEHIENDINLNGIDNIALCCVSCNVSKGTKLLADWLRGDYCKRKGISSQTVAPVVMVFLEKV